jgi:hypothetical protein
MKRRILVAALAVAAMLAVPGAVSADANNSNRDDSKMSQVAIHLSAFDQQAYRVSRGADTLLLQTRDQQTSWESHIYYLNTLRKGINDMGRMLAELEELKPQASEEQQMAIERARPNLVALADKTEKAINLVNTERWNVRQPEYEATIAELSQHADRLYQTVDSIVDYHNAKDRLQGLEPAYGSSEN